MEYYGGDYCCGCGISSHGLQHKLQILARTEPLNEDRSPPHHEARTVKLEMEDKMVQIKKTIETTFGFPFLISYREKKIPFGSNPFVDSPFSKRSLESKKEMQYSLLPIYSTIGFIQYLLFTFFLLSLSLSLTLSLPLFGSMDKYSVVTSYTVVTSYNLGNCR